MPAIQPIVAKHWRAMESQDKYLAQCVTQPPLTEFQGQTNIGECVVKFGPTDYFSLCLCVCLFQRHLEYLNDYFHEYKIN